jgi:hypothetical protein
MELEEQSRNLFAQISEELKDLELKNMELANLTEA